MTLDKMWAPWRAKYINLKREKGCIFCPGKKAKNAAVLKTRHSISILNIFPYNAGHVMVAPNRHVKSLALLRDDELLDLIKHVNAVQKIMEKQLKPDGFNIGINLGRAAGAGITGHIHIHIVPRWAGDTNFMPVIGSTKVISESLESLGKKLKKGRKYVKQA